VTGPLEPPARVPAADGPGVLRPLVHAAVGLCAFALGVLPRWAALALAGLAIVANWVVLPRLAVGRRLERPGEPFLGGLRTYPVAVLGLVALLPPAEAAAAWAVLAWGDAAASLAGRFVRAPALFGHPKATWSGTPALFLVGTLGAFAAGHGVAALATHATWVDAGVPPSLARCALAAFAAALVDLVRIPPDDNLPCAAAAGGTLALLRSVV
jgi:dolichol kinase